MYLILDMYSVFNDYTQIDGIKSRIIKQNKDCFSQDTTCLNCQLHNETLENMFNEIS